jgi:arginine exporter protein ArgO
MRAMLSSVFLFLMSFGAFAVEEANKDAEIAHTGTGAVIAFGVVVLIFCGWVVWAIKKASKKQAEEDAAKK